MFKRFWAYLRDSQESQRVTLIVFAALLAVQLAFVSFYSASNVGSRSVMGALDDDAGWNIDKTVHTRWYKDNGWALYGPFYFRINHTINALLPKLISSPDESPNEVHEKSAHYSIMTVSALSVFGIALLISCIALKQWTDRLILSMILVAAIFGNHIWSLFFLRAHPDLLLSFFVAISGFYTLRFIDGDGQKYFRTSAIFWGLATCIKLSIGLFIPGLILLLRPISKAAVRRMFIYFGWMFLAYFVIGFPQNIVLDRPIRDLLHQNAFSHFAEWSWILRTLGLTWEQSWRPALVILIYALFFHDSEFRFQKKSLFWIWAFWLISYAGLITRHSLSPSDHYPLPFVALFWVFLLCTLVSVLPRSIWGTKWLEWPAPVRGALLLLAFYPLNRGFVPEQLAVALEEQAHCRPEMEAVHRWERQKIKAGETLMVDPYVPYPTEEKDKYVFNDWGFTLEELASDHPNILVLNQLFYSRFLGGTEPSAYVKADSPNWKPRRQFYEMFDDKPEVTDPSGAVWKRTESNACGIRIYEKAGIDSKTPSGSK